VEEACLVLNVSQIPQFDRVVHRRRDQQPITAGIELCVRHFRLVQLVAKDLELSKQQNVLIQDSRSVIVTYTYRICSEMSANAQRNVKQNNTNITNITIQGKEQISTLYTVFRAKGAASFFFYE